MGLKGQRDGRKANDIAWAIGCQDGRVRLSILLPTLDEIGFV
jgi:hypothetical protein